MASRAAKLSEILNELRSASPDVIGAAAVSVDGFVMASVLPSEREEDVLSGLSAAMLGLGERISRELLRSELKQIFVRGDNGYVLLNGAGREAILVTLLNAKAKLGLVFLDSARAAKAIEEIL